jgi:hypothetical protein
MVKSKKRQPRKLVELEEDAEGWPMLPDTTGWNRAEQQHMIRSFLTKLYSMYFLFNVRNDLHKA